MAKNLLHNSSAGEILKTEFIDKIIPYHNKVGLKEQHA